MLTYGDSWWLLKAICYLWLWLACAAYSSLLADAKGRSDGLWFLGGLLTGPVALIAAAGMPKREGRAERR